MNNAFMEGRSLFFTFKGKKLKDLKGISTASRLYSTCPYIKAKICLHSSHQHTIAHTLDILVSLNISDFDNMTSLPELWLYPERLNSLNIILFEVIIIECFFPPFIFPFRMKVTLMEGFKLIYMLSLKSPLFWTME